MESSDNQTNDYPQKLYANLSNPEFREFLYLSYKEVEGNKSIFKLEINGLGKLAKEYFDILFEVARKEYELKEEEEGNIGL